MKETTKKLLAGLAVAAFWLAFIWEPWRAFWLCGWLGLEFGPCF
jgi:hypothetical protein